MNSFYCHFYKNAPVIRDPKKIYYVPYSLYGDEVYPNYCAGLAYMFDSRMLPDLLETTSEVMFPIHDDVFYTGIMAKKMGATHHIFPMLCVWNTYKQPNIFPK